MNRRSSRLLLIAVSVLSASATFLPADEGLTLTPELVVDLNSVAAVELDPQGVRVAYTLSVQRDVKEDPGKGYSQLWLAVFDQLNTGGAAGDPRQFTSGKESVGSLSWSPDGKLISFLTKRESVDEHTQIYVMPGDGGEAKPITRHGASVSAYRWAPDGRSIAFVARRPETEEAEADKKAGKDWKVDEDLVPRVLWRFDLETEEAVELLADLNVWDLEWTPDGKQLIVQASATPRTDDSMVFKRIYTLPATGGEARLVVETRGKLGPMSVSPDGSTLAWLGAVSENDPIAQSVFVVPLGPARGGAARNLTEDYRGSAAGLAWLSDSTLLVSTVEGEGNRLFRVDAKSGRRTAVEWGRRIIGEFSVRPGVDRIAFAAHAPEHPAELFVGGIGQEPQQRSRHNPDLAGIRLARQEVVSWKGADDWDIGGVLTYPLDYTPGVRYPLVLQIHGGPEGVSLNGWTTGAGYPVQLLAKAGYMVLQPNYRGSMGKGVAFSKADHNDLGGKEYEDVLAGIDALVERGLVDGARVGTAGWSYGGYFSAWGATRHSERFKASIVAAGLTNWISFAGTTDIPNEMSIVHWNSWWFDEPELHWQRSPLAHLNKAQTPTLIVHGEKDDRVHPEQSIQLYTNLRLKGVPTSLVLYPREPHGLTERAHELDFIERTLDWFGTWLGPSTGSEQEREPVSGPAAGSR